MPITSATVVNAALEQIASQKQITSLADGSTAANAASVIYAPTVQMMLRELDPDFARFTAVLAIQAGATAPPPWTYAYTYPADCVRLRQVRPPASGAGSLTDPNDPAPIFSNIAMVLVSTAPTKVILANQLNALAVYTSDAVTEAEWDLAFFDAVVRRLANPLAMALSGRPNFADSILQQAAASAQMAEAVDEAMITGP